MRAGLDVGSADVAGPREGLVNLSHQVGDFVQARFLLAGEARVEGGCRGIHCVLGGRCEREESVVWLWVGCGWNRKEH